MSATVTEIAAASQSTYSSWQGSKLTATAGRFLLVATSKIIEKVRRRHILLSSSVRQSVVA